MTESIAKSTANELSKNFIARLEVLWGKKFDSILEKLRDGVQEYLERQQERFMWTKTFLHRDPVYFYEIYFPLRITHKDAPKNIKSYNDIFKINSRVAIIGQAGSGKSTIMRHLFLNIIQKGEYEIPLFIELRRVTTEISLTKYIEQFAIGGGLVLTGNALKTLFEDGKIILFLDGFDEIAPDCYTKVVQTIDDLCTQFPKTKMLVTGRPGSRVETIRNLECAQMTALNTSEIKKFISLQKLGAENEVRILSVVSRISKERKSYLHDYLSNPLLLSLFILTCNTTKQLPDRKSAFYRRVIDTLFVEHDSVSKPDYDRRLRAGLSQVKFEQLLQRFSAISYFNSRFEFDKDYIHTTFKRIVEKSQELEANFDNVIKDLVVGVGLWTEDGGMHSFSHRSLQEYFAAAFIAGLETAKKQEIYSRLVSKLRSGRTPEIQNFLSLCQEVDEQAYLRFFLLPITHSFLSYFENKGLPEAGAKIIRGLIARVFIEDEDISNRPNKTLDERRRFFGQISWQYVKESEVLGLSQIHPDLFRAVSFYFFFEGPLQKLLKDSKIQKETEKIKDFHIPHLKHPASYNLSTGLEEKTLAQYINGDPKGGRIFLDLKTELEASAGKWQKRLAELDYADATLITELL